MGDVAYTAHIRIDKKEGPLRLAHLPGADGPVRFGVHGAIAEHYGAEVEREDATTIDYVIAATAG